RSVAITRAAATSSPTTNARSITDGGYGDGGRNSRLTRAARTSASRSSSNATAPSLRSETAAACVHTRRRLRIETGHDLGLEPEFGDAEPVGQCAHDPDGVVDVDGTVG